VANDSRDLEILVAKIQRQLAPDAEVLHNVRLDGRESKTKRQIDVLVRQKIGQYEMSIVLDCKDYERPVDVKGVEEFYGLVRDVGAQKGALVCPKGFTGAAKTRATGLQIELYSPIDTEPHKWQVHVTAPVVCDFRRAAMSFRLSGSASAPFRLADNFFESVPAFKNPETRLGIPLEAAMSKWNEGRFPTEPGEHNGLPIFDEAEVLLDNGYGQLVPVTLTVTLLVEQQLFFGELPIQKISGFKNELSGEIITNAFKTGIFDPQEVWDHWKRITSMDELPTQPMFALRGLVGWVR
jgi:Restriction endonuclease